MNTAALSQPFAENFGSEGSLELFSAEAQNLKLRHRCVQLMSPTYLGYKRSRLEFSDRLPLYLLLYLLNTLEVLQPHHLCFQFVYSKTITIALQTVVYRMISLITAVSAYNRRISYSSRLFHRLTENERK